MEGEEDRYAGLPRPGIPRHSGTYMKKYVQKLNCLLQFFLLKFFLSDIIFLLSTYSSIHLLIHPSIH